MWWLKITVFWVVAQCSVVDEYKHFRGACFLDLHARINDTLITEATCFTKIFLPLFHIIWCRIFRPFLFAPSFTFLAFIPSSLPFFFALSHSFILSIYHKLSAQLNGDLHSVGWEKVWCSWQSASGYCPQPVGVQGTWCVASEVCFPSPSWRDQPTTSLYYNGDSCEYHEERVWNNYLCNMFVGEGSFLLHCILYQPNIVSVNWIETKEKDILRDNSCFISQKYGG